MGKTVREEHCTPAVCFVYVRGICVCAASQLPRLADHPWKIRKENKNIRSSNVIEVEDFPPSLLHVPQEIHHQATEQVRGQLCFPNFRESLLRPTFRSKFFFQLNELNSTLFDLFLSKQVIEFPLLEFFLEKFLKKVM